MTQNSVNYGDIFCQAVSNIVNHSIAQLEFDISRECTITKINDKAFGKYQVSDGSMSFEAIAGAGTYYEVGDRVMVTIPKGDYNKQISILTKIVDIWSGPAGFVRPLNTIIECTDNIAVQASKEALIANGEVKAIEILRLENQKFLGFQKMGISADFKTLINGLNVIDGTYGLRFSLIELDPEAKDANGNSIRKEKQVQQFIFSSKDMLGNPYEFSTYFTQEYAFDMPENFSRIHEVIVEFYQDNNFINGNKQEIEVSKVNNLFVNNLKIYFGYDINKTLGEIVEIHSDYLTYDSTTTKHIELSWFHKIDENTMQKIDQKSDQNIFGVRWYKYVSGCAEENTDDYGGKNWFLLNPPNNENDLAGSLMDKYPFTTLDPIFIKDEFPFSLEAPVLETKEQEQFKAVCLMKTYPYINDPTYEVIERWASNTLTFDNTKEESSGGESAGQVIEKELSLVFSDNSFGNYFLYDQNGELLDIKEGINKSRSITLYYKDAEINEDNFIDITKIEWSLPNKANSMITYDETQHDDQASPKSFTYSILNDLNKDLGDNTIKCSVYVSGQLYATLYETLRFGKQGSNGTTTTFILEMMDGKNALPLTHYVKNLTITEENFTNYNLYIKSNDDYNEATEFNASETYYEKVADLRVQAILIKDTGKRIYFTDEEKSKIKWALLNNKYLTEAHDGDIITLSYDDGRIPSDHYTILKASYQYDDGPTLETYLPIPIKNSKCDYMVGATQILYNHQGIPRYNNGIYIAKSDNVEYKTWDVKQGDKNPNVVTLKQLQDGKGISASPLFSKGSKKDSSENLLEIQDEVCVYCTHNNEIVWSQPILIMQSHYDFAMLNSWDGSLTINDKNGTILSTMLGAGRKNAQNKFSGVLIGDIQDGTQLNDTETLTGVYGLQNGIITYGLKEDGTAFFGAYNNGRIEINGTSGVIKSPKAGGMSIDLDDGLITASKFDLSSGYWGSNDPDKPQGRVILSTNGVNDSSLGDEQSYRFGVGTKDNYIYLSTNGKMAIRAQTFNLTADNDNIIISNEQFLVKSNDNNKIDFSSTNGLVIKATNFNLSSGYWGSDDDSNKTQGRVILSTSGICDSNAGDGTSTYLFGVGTNVNYMYLNTNGNLVIKTKNFSVNTDGTVIVNGSGTFSGNITATSLTLENGVTVPYSSISGTPDLTIYIAKDGTIGTVADGSTGISISSQGLLQASNAIIYGNIYAGGGAIAGWKINNNSLLKGNVDEENSFCIYSQGTTPSKSFAGSGNKNNWRLTIGRNFGIDSNGNVYCNNLKATSGYFTGDISGASWNGVELVSNYLSYVIDMSFANLNVYRHSVTINDQTIDYLTMDPTTGTRIGSILGISAFVQKGGQRFIGWT